MLYIAKVILQFCIFVIVGAQFFSPISKVVNLDSKNFNKEVLKSDKVWLVKFYAPWCGQSQKFVPEYEKAANALGGVVGVGAVDIDVHKDLQKKYGIRHFPTVKLFFGDQSKPEEFHGKRTAETLVQTAMSAIKRKIDSQLKKKMKISKHVVKLTDNNFRDMVLKSHDMWFVEFHAPWCKTCQKLEDAWAEAAAKLIGKVHFGMVDASMQKFTAQDYDIVKIPTVKYFLAGPKKQAFNYNFSGSSMDLMGFALEKLQEYKPPPEIKQVTNYNTFICVEANLCIISFLPKLSDCNEKCRNSYLDLLKKIAEKFKTMPWGWMWSEANEQPALQRVLGIGGSGYPTMVAADAKKKIYSVLHGAFSEKGITEFLDGLAHGRGNINEIKDDAKAQIGTLWETIEDTQIFIEKYDEKKQDEAEKNEHLKSKTINEKAKEEDSKIIQQSNGILKEEGVDKEVKELLAKRTKKEVKRKSSKRVKNKRKNKRKGKGSAGRKHRNKKRKNNHKNKKGMKKSVRVMNQ